MVAEPTDGESTFFALERLVTPTGATDWVWEADLPSPSSVPPIRSRVLAAAMEVAGLLAIGASVSKPDIASEGGKLVETYRSFGSMPRSKGVTS